MSKPRTPNVERQRRLKRQHRDHIKVKVARRIASAMQQASAPPTTRRAP